MIQSQPVPSLSSSTINIQLDKKQEEEEEEEEEEDFIEIIEKTNKSIPLTPTTMYINSFMYIFSLIFFY